MGKNLKLCVSAWSAAPVFAADSTPNLADAVRKEEAIFEHYYKFVVFVDQGQPSRLVYQDLEKFEIHQ